MLYTLALYKINAVKKCHCSLLKQVYQYWLHQVVIDFTLVCICCIPDPYVRISFGTQSQVSEIIHRTLCPTWDQTLIFENVYIYGSPEITEESPPHVVLELFDQDPVVSC